MTIGNVRNYGVSTDAVITRGVMTDDVSNYDVNRDGVSTDAVSMGGADTDSNSEDIAGGATYNNPLLVASLTTGWLLMLMHR